MGLQPFSESFAYLLLSDSELEWSLGKQCISQEREVFHPLLGCMHAWFSQAGVMQEETFLTANNPSSSSTLDISTFLRLILFSLLFFFSTG